MTCEVVLFDLGGVVVDVESDRLVHQMAQLLGRSFEEVQEVVYHRELLVPLELGRISPEAYYHGLSERLQLPWTYDQFVRSWNDMISEKTQVTGILRRLHRRHKLMALTNTNVLHLAHIKTRYPSLSVFDDWVASCEVGLRKPDAQMYRLAVDRAGVRPDAAVYVEDRPELIEAGRAVGLTAIRFENPEQLEAELSSLRITID